MYTIKLKVLHTSLIYLCPKPFPVRLVGSLPTTSFQNGWQQIECRISPLFCQSRVTLVSSLCFKIFDRCKKHQNGCEWHVRYTYYNQYKFQNIESLVQIKTINGLNRFMNS